MFLRRLVTMIGLAALAVALYGGPATAFPPGARPAVTCETVSIDPATWISVTFSGTIGGVAFSRTVSYGAEHSHIAIAHIDDLTTATGPIVLVVTATSPYLGTSPTTTVTLTCHPAPSTTTTSPSTSTSTSSSTSTTVAPTTTTTTIATTTTSTQIIPPISATIAPPAPRLALPRTGGDSRPLAAVGGGLLGAGTLALILVRRGR